VNYLKWAVAVLLLAGSFAAGHHVAALAGQVKLAAVTQANAKDAQHVAELATKASEAARAVEGRQAIAFDAISGQYEQDKEHAQADADRTIADLRAGNLRLRAAWRCPATRVPEAGASTGKPDASAADRDESAARVVRAAAEADAQIRALQAILTAERQP